MTKIFTPEVPAGSLWKPGLKYPYATWIDPIKCGNPKHNGTNRYIVESSDSILMYLGEHKMVRNLYGTSYLWCRFLVESKAVWVYDIVFNSLERVELSKA